MKRYEGKKVVMIGGTTGMGLAKAALCLAFDATSTTGAELPVDGEWSQL